MSEPKAKEIIVSELISGGHTRSSAEYLVNSLAYFARAEAMEEAARLLDRERQPMLADCVRALKEKQG